MKIEDKIELETTDDANGLHQCPVYAKSFPRNQVTGSAMPKRLEVALPCALKAALPILSNWKSQAQCMRSKGKEAFWISQLHFPLVAFCWTFGVELA